MKTLALLFLMGGSFLIAGCPLGSVGGRNGSGEGTCRLAVTVSPAEGGTVVRSPDLPGYQGGTTVTLTANPAAGYFFYAWEGQTTGYGNTAEVTLWGNKTIVAVFRPVFALTVTVSPPGAGMVTGGFGKQQEVLGTTQYRSGSPVTLTANPAAGYEFSRWEGGMSSSANPATIKMDGEKAVTAVFAPATTPLIRLSTSKVFFHVDCAECRTEGWYDRPVDITNGGIGTLEGLSLRFPNGCPRWLSATFDGSVAPTVLTIRVILAELSGLDSSSQYGDQTARVEIALTGANNSPQFVDVTVSGYEQPVMDYSHFGLPTGGGSMGYGKVICAELHRQGLMQEAIWKADERFGEYLRENQRDVLLGYQLWAKPVVKWMQQSRTITEIVAAVAAPWSYEMAYRMGARDNGSFAGGILMDVGVPVCRVIGRVAKWVNDDAYTGTARYCPGR